MCPAPRTPAAPAPPGAIPAGERLIHALDGMALAEAVAAARALAGVVRLFKVGPALVYQGGLDACRQVARAGGPGARVFLDMKTWDIPEQVRGALAAVARFGGEDVAMVTVHGDPGLRRALEAPGPRPFRVFAVTLLTSAGPAQLAALGWQGAVTDFVVQQAREAREAGCDGVVCSGAEAGAVKAALPGCLTITPGIRPAWAQVAGDDQQRVVTPGEAIRQGADYLVVGRPIRAADDPRAAAGRIQAEIAAALEEAPRAD